MNCGKKKHIAEGNLKKKLQGDNVKLAYFTEGKIILTLFLN
jgi:hypothetical protein